ncbi:hypothetical protein MATL_G00098070 [Megalops atlanticus]|uniref:Uncharacterized protein n=1 Tax=Megalops atlanticus TaxID=7932 RepID=A0A9D3T6N0_MEGAT|nr:hypothetical protein MATL_G00098070 [Megalops atlanticus]
MAEAADCIGDSSALPVHSAVDSATVMMAPPTLEDLTEEEDVFLPESNPAGQCPKKEKSPRNGSTVVQVSNEGPGETAMENQMENQFLHLAIRKQVSYRAVSPDKWKATNGNYEMDSSNWIQSAPL